MADLHDRWVAERRNERYYRLAKKLNYRSRASFKLIQIDNRFGIFREGDRVVDLGACPGGWLQVAQERTWPNGRVIGVDLRYIRPIEGVETIVGDITEDSTMVELLERFGGKADVVLSDMAPNIAGHYSMDHARSIDLCMYAVDVCDRILRKEGKLVMKVFMGDMMDSLLGELRSRFQSVKVHSPDASRDTSSEVYVICQGFYARSGKTLRAPEVEERAPEFTPKGGYIRGRPDRTHGMGSRTRMIYPTKRHVPRTRAHMCQPPRSDGEGRRTESSWIPRNLNPHAIGTAPTGRRSGPAAW